MAFPRLQWWFRGGKEREKGTIFADSSLNSSSHLGLGPREADTEEFPSLKGAKISFSSQRKITKKWQSREERRMIDREYDVVLVPSDGVCLSGSDSDDSDWSIGWLEPHGSEFLSDDETGDSFAVLVPCYRNDRKGLVEGPNKQLSSAVKNPKIGHFTGKSNSANECI